MLALGFRAYRRGSVGSERHTIITPPSTGARELCALCDYVNHGQKIFFLFRWVDGVVGLVRLSPCRVCRVRPPLFLFWLNSCGFVFRSVAHVLGSALCLQVRKEISAIEWFPLDALPKGSFGVEPFIPRLRRWMAKTKGMRAPKDATAGDFCFTCVVWWGGGCNVRRCVR